MPFRDSLLYTDRHKEFAERVIASENNAITPALAKKIAKAEKEMNEGKTVHFNNLDELDNYLDTL